MANGPVTSYIAGSEAANRKRLAGLQTQALEAKAEEGEEVSRMKILSNLAFSIKGMPYESRGPLIDREIQTITQKPPTPKRQQLYQMLNEFREQPEAQQDQFGAQMISLGQARGILKTPAVVKTDKPPKPGQPKNFLVKDPKTGEFVVGSLQFAGTTAYRAGSEEVVPAGDFKPIPKKGMSVTLPDGTKIQVGGDSGASLTPPVKTELQKGVVHAYELGNNIQKSLDTMEDRWLTLPGKLDQKIGQWKSLAGEWLPKGMEQTPEDKAELRKISEWKSNIRRDLVSYIKSMSGVAYSEKEFKIHESSFPNPSMDPETFKGAAKGVIDRVKTKIRLYNQVLATGFKGSKEEVVKKVDEMFISGEQGDPESRNDQLAEEMFPDGGPQTAEDAQKIIDRLAQEGYNLKI